MFNVENLDPQDFDPMYHGALICNKKASFSSNTGSHISINVFDNI
jgi:hypothetical protein